MDSGFQTQDRLTSSKYNNNDLRGKIVYQENHNEWPIFDNLKREM